jgi:hypothetical protein
MSLMNPSGKTQDNGLCVMSMAFCENLSAVTFCFLWVCGATYAAGKQAGLLADDHIARSDTTHRLASVHCLVRRP